MHSLGLPCCAIKSLSFMCRVRTEFQSFLITFGKITSTAGSPAGQENNGAIQTLQDIAEQHPDIAEAARYSRITWCQIHRDASMLGQGTGAHQAQYASVLSHVMRCLLCRVVSWCALRRTVQQSSVQAGTICNLHGHWETFAGQPHWVRGIDTYCIVTEVSLGNVQVKDTRPDTCQEEGGEQ